MAHTAELRRQHDAATQLMAGITGQIRAYRGRDDAYRLTLGVAQLLGQLRIHWTKENGHLYPALIHSGDRQAAAMARRFAGDMGDLAERLEEFAMRWSTSAGIAARFDEFRTEAIDIFAAIKVRIRAEKQLLYPLADRLAQPPLRAAA